jgi:hypothetical protein
MTLLIFAIVAILVIAVHFADKYEETREWLFPTRMSKEHIKYLDLLQKVELFYNNLNSDNWLKVTTKFQVASGHAHAAYVLVISLGYYVFAGDRKKQVKSQMTKGELYNYYKEYNKELKGYKTTYSNLWNGKRNEVVLICPDSKDIIPYKQINFVELYNILFDTQKDIIPELKELDRDNKIKSLIS